MKEEILNELFFSNKKKDFTFNSEQKKEYQEMVAQIKKIGPGIVEKYNRDSKLLDSLKKALRRDLLPLFHDEKDVTEGMNPKFSFSMEEVKLQDQKRYPHEVNINILDKSIEGAMEDYWGENDPDNIMDCTERVVDKIYEEVGKAIVAALSPKTLKVGYSYDDMFSALDITFIPRENYNESANINAINEICDNIYEWIDDIDEDYVMEADIEYISEGVGDIFKKINSNIESYKKKLKDRTTKFKDKLHKNFDTESLNSLKSGKYFTDKKITINDYIPLRSAVDISKDMDNFFDDLTIIFEDAWKKIMKVRNNRSSFVDYKSAMKEANQIESDMDKEYKNIDITSKVEEIFNVNKKPETHTFTNKDLANMIQMQHDMEKFYYSADELYKNATDVIDEFNADIQHLAAKYSKDIANAEKSKEMTKEDKDYFKYLIDSAKNLSNISSMTYEALDEFDAEYEEKMEWYIEKLESYFKAVGLDSSDKKARKNLMLNSATEDSGEVIEEGFFDKNKDPKKEKLSAEQLDEVKSLKATIKKVAPDIIKAENKNKDAVDGLAKAIDELTCTDQKIAPKFEYTFDSEANNSISFWAYSKPIVNAIKKEYEEGGEVDYHFIKFTDSATSYIIKQIKKELNMKTVSVVVYGGSGNSANSIEFVFIPKDKSKKYNGVKESAESLDEGFIKKLSEKHKKAIEKKKREEEKRKHDERVKNRDFTKEEKQEVKRIKDTIKKQGSKIISDLNNDKEAVDALQHAIDRYLVDESMGDKHIDAKFEYNDYTETSSNFNIGILSDDIMKAAYDADEDSVEKFGSVVVKYANDVEKAIMDELGKTTVKVEYSYWGYFPEAVGVLNFEFIPR